MCLLARVNLCSVTDEAKQYFVTMLLWLDSDQTHFDYSLFFFFWLWGRNYISGCGSFCVRRAKSKDPLCRTESWLWGIGLRMSCAQRSSPTLICWQWCTNTQSYNPPSVHISVRCTQNIVHTGDKHELSPSNVQIFLSSQNALLRDRFILFWSGNF